MTEWFDHLFTESAECVVQFWLFCLAAGFIVGWVIGVFV